MQIIKGNMKDRNRNSRSKEIKELWRKKERNGKTKNYGKEKLIKLQTEKNGMKDMKGNMKRSISKKTDEEKLRKLWNGDEIRRQVTHNNK